MSQKKARTIPPDSKPDSVNEEEHVKKKTSVRKKFDRATEKEIVHLKEMITQTWRFDKYQIRNCQSFLKCLENSIFTEHEGWYVVITNGIVWPVTFEHPIYAFEEKGLQIHSVHSNCIQDSQNGQSIR
jgi:hypothetical protein